MTTEVVKPGVDRSRLDRPPLSRPLKVQFVTTNHLPYVGGAEFSTHHLAAALTERGHDVAVLTGLTRRSLRGLIDLGLAAAKMAPVGHADDLLGYQTVRSVRPLEVLKSHVRVFRPDVIVVTGSDPRFAVPALAISEPYPSILYMRVGASAQFIADVRHADLLIANSKAIAASIRSFGKEAVFLPSVFPPQVYRVPTTREKVLLVNPIPKKGVQIAMSLAEARPDIPFVFNLSWRMRSSALRRLRRALRPLGNVEVRRATTHPEELYRDCRLVLVPSQCEEAWCRVVSESQINAIPALASNIAGLPESVGPGGILVDPKDSTAAWLDALCGVWDDNVRYNELSRRALAHSQRPELSVPVVVDRFERLMSRAIEEHARCVKSPSA